MARRNPPIGSRTGTLTPRQQAALVAGWTPEQVHSARQGAARGDYQLFSSLVDSMLTDDHVRATTETLISSVSGADVEWHPGDDSDEAQRSRDVIAGLWHQVHADTALRADVAVAQLTGAAVVQQVWGSVVFEGKRYAAPVEFSPVLLRDTRIGDDWAAEVRTYEGDVSWGGIGRWIRTDYEPDRWLVAYARFPGVRRTLAGALLACAWPWLGKLRCSVFELVGLEKFGDPVLALIGTANGTRESREAGLDMVERLSSGESAFLEEGSNLVVVESARQTGQAHADAIARRDSAISKAILGSTLNTEIGAAGGNRAAAESQADTTILPRQRALAELVSETIQTQWAAPILRYAGLSGALPEMTIVLEQEEVPTIIPEAFAAGVYTRNHLLRASRLEPIDGDEGEERVRPQSAAPASPGNATPSAAAEPKAESALNGAQVASLLAVVEKVAQGLISRESGIAALMTSFGMTRERAEENLGPIDFVPRVKVDESAVVEPVEASNVAGDDGAANVDHADRVKSPTTLDMSDEYAGFLRLSGEKQEAIASLIGRPREAIARGVDATADILRAEYAALAERLADASSQDEAESIAMAWAAELAESERITEAAYHANALAQMAGVETARMELDRSDGVKRLSLADERFLGLSFEEALALFRERSGRAAAAIDAMLEEELARARMVTRAMSEHAELAILDGIDSALQVDGMSLRDFVREFADRVDADDLPGGDAGYLRTVYTTTVATSYEAGRQEVLTDPDIVEQIGGYEIVTVGDDRTEPSHAALDGMQVRGADAARMKFTPWRYGCRCEVVAVDAEDMDESRIIDPSALDSVIFDGFGDPVGYLRNPS
jgi:hypothetical protein